MTKSNRELDDRMMARALSLARRGEGRVEPNPMVGCVIARGDRVLGEGYHRRFGGPHAEVNALRACSSRPVGATAYVTLEPCCHFGKTPPCAEALIESGVSRVVVALRDPHPLVDGGGLDRLRRAGLRVDVGLGSDEAIEILAPFLTRTILQRPYVIAKWAQSLDGKLATRTGQSQWISGEPARRLVHRLRARVDAIMVGINTVLCDDPMLTARDVPRRRLAMRVVLDAKPRLPVRSRVVTTARQVPTVVLTSRERLASPRSRLLERAGVVVHGCGMRFGRISPRECLRHLARLNVTNLMIEGGPTVLSSFLRAGLVDEAWVFTAPILIGSNEAPGPFDDGRTVDIASALRPRALRIVRVGDDSFHRLWLTDPPRLAH